MEEYKRPTKFIIKDRHIVPSLEEADIQELDKLSEERLKVCQSCENFEIKQNGSKVCNLCGCHLGRRIKAIYPLDEEGKAIRQIKPDQENIYVCPLKKW